MKARMHTVALTDMFEDDAEDAGLTDDQVIEMAAILSADPQQGDIVVGSGGVRKVRFAGRGKGKSGGYRAFTFYAGANRPLYLLALLGKGERENINAEEKKALKRLAKELKG